MKVLELSTYHPNSPEEAITLHTCGREENVSYANHPSKTSPPLLQENPGLSQPCHTERLNSDSIHLQLFDHKSSLAYQTNPFLYSNYFLCELQVKTHD